jgi:hypothetical protein
MQSLPADTDDQTVTRVLAGEIEAFDVLMRRYNQRLYRAARAILGSDADAEDAVQQAYMNAFQQLGQFAGRAQFSTWLTRIVAHQNERTLGYRRSPCGVRQTGSRAAHVRCRTWSAPQCGPGNATRELSLRVRPP